MKLIHKLTLGFLTVAMLMAVVGGIQVAFIHEIGHDVRAIESSNIGEVQGAIDIAYRVALIGADMNEYLLAAVAGHAHDGLADRQRIMDDLALIEKVFDELKGATETGLDMAEDEEDEAGEASEMEEIAELEALIAEYEALIKQTFELAASHGYQAAATVFLNRHPELEERIRDGSRDLFSDAIGEIQEAVGEVGEAVTRAVMYTLGLSLAALVLAIVIGLLVSRPLSLRIRRLQAATRALQAGQRDIQVDEADSRDEVADLTQAFNEMARELKSSTASIEDLNSQVRKRRRAEAALRKAHDELEERVRQRTRDLDAARLEAESANRTKSEFLANMSHELRTPLNHIIGFTELIAAEKLGGINEMQKEYLNDVLSSSKHLLALINDILDLSKVEAGKLELMLTKIDAQAMLNNCLVMFKEKAMKHHIELDLACDDAPDTILADEIKMKQILYNLLSNAFKFTPDKGYVSLRAWKVNGDPVSRVPGMELPGDAQLPTWAIEVSDSGTGIHPQDLERIFNPFEQGLNSTAERQEGTGLGLALTRRMVELHGGRIRAASNGKGQGATFTIVLPESADTPVIEE